MNSRKLALILFRRILEKSAEDELWQKAFLDANTEASKDRRLVYEIVFGTIKNLILIDYLLEGFFRKKPENMVLDILRISFYQMVFLDRVPDYAVINEAVNLVDDVGYTRNKKFVNAVLRSVQRRKKEMKESIFDESLAPAIKYSIPEWLYRRMEEQYGLERTDKFGSLALLPPNLTIRIRTENISIEEAENIFKSEGIDYELINDGPWSLIYSKEKFLAKGYLTKGWCHVQDYSSGIAARLFSFEEKKEARVLDMCAAPGGKSLQLLDYTVNKKASVICNDVNPDRLERLEENLKNIKNGSYKITNFDGRKISGSFTHILLDAPCTALGTIRKNPDIKYKKRMDDIERMHLLQLELLEKAAVLVESGGEIVYTTCSVDRKENQEVIGKFLKKHAEFSVSKVVINDIKEYLHAEGWYLMFPDENHEGAFAVKLIKSH